MLKSKIKTIQSECSLNLPVVLIRINGTVIIFMPNDLPKSSYHSHLHLRTYQNAKSKYGINVLIRCRLNYLTDANNLSDGSTVGWTICIGYDGWFAISGG